LFALVTYLVQILELALAFSWLKIGENASICFWDLKEPRGAAEAFAERIPATRADEPNAMPTMWRNWNIL
jgi:hypothetical protein